MAFQIRGKLEVIEPTTEIQSKNGGVFYRRSFVLDCTRYNPDTGEPWENHPQFELGGNQCAMLDNFHIGQRVDVSFTLRGTKYQDRATGEWKYFTTISAFDIKPVQEQPQTVQNTQPQQPTYQQQVSDARLQAARTSINVSAPAVQQPLAGSQQPAYVQPGVPQYGAPKSNNDNPPF